jgi:hypothetical protein
MKFVAAFICFLAISFAAKAADKPDRELAIQYLEASRFEEIINTSLDSYGQQLFKNLPNADRMQIDKMLKETMGWDATKNQLADLVAKIYTADELKAYIAFVKTPLGASGAAKSNEFSAQFATMLSQNFLKFIREHPIQENQATNPRAAR